MCSMMPSQMKAAFSHAFSVRRFMGEKARVCAVQISIALP